MLGREAITIKGACLSSKHIPKARFLAGNTVLEVSCSVTDHVVATCVTPTLFRIGMVQLEFDPDGRGWKFIDHLTSSKYQECYGFRGDNLCFQGSYVSMGLINYNVIHLLDIVQYSFRNHAKHVTKKHTC